jgi:hypothetical protein
MRAWEWEGEGHLGLQFADLFQSPILSGYLKTECGSKSWLSHATHSHQRGNALVRQARSFVRGSNIPFKNGIHRCTLRI